VLLERIRSHNPTVAGIRELAQLKHLEQLSDKVLDEYSEEAE
jgi:hypothetical protein